MRTRGTRSVAALVLLLLVALSAGDRARAGEDTAVGAWVFDVRVVRILGTSPDVVEQGPAWALDETASPVVTLPWKDLWTSLEERGRAVLLLDRRVTAVEGTDAQIVDSQSRPGERFERRDSHNETWGSASVETGVTARLSAAGTLRYEIDVRWDLELPAGATRGRFTGLSRWNGTWPRLNGKTLVLGHRQQVPAAGDAAPIPVEIYAFVTVRFVP
jgi:hypothetical protein